MTRDQALQKTRDLLRLRHMSLATEQCYLVWLARFMRLSRVELPHAARLRGAEFIG